MLACRAGVKWRQFSSARAMRAATCGLRASSAITCSAQKAWPLPSAAWNSPGLARKKVPSSA